MSGSFRDASRTAIAVVLVLSGVSAAARASDVNTRDVTPNPAVMFMNMTEQAAFADDKKVLVFTGRGGFRISENAGIHWERAMNGYLNSAGIEPFGNGFCQAPSLPSTVYSLSGVVPREPVFKSTDLGKSWQPVGAIDADVIVLDCAVDWFDPNRVYATMFDLNQGTGSLLRSDDGGSTWNAAGFDLPPAPFYLRTSPVTRGVVYVTEALGDPAIDGLYISSDGGNSFTRSPAPLFLPERIVIDRHGGLFIPTLDLRLFRSLDGGTTFTELFVANPINSVAVAPDDPSIVYVTDTAGIGYRSTDGGDTFTALEGTATAPLPVIGHIAVSPSKNGRSHLLATTPWGPFRSDDDGASFFPVTDTFRGASVNDLAIDANGRLLAATFHTQALFRAQRAGHPRLYDPLGTSLVLQDFTLEWDGVAVAAAPGDPDRIVLVTNQGVFSTADGGAHWTDARVRPFGSQARVTFAPGDASRVYLVGANSLFRSDDAGISFTRLQGGGFGTVAVDPRNADVLHLGATGRGLFKSTDGGFTVTGPSIPGTFRSISIDPRNPDTVYAGNAAGGVLRTTDAGASWTSASAGLPGGEVLGVAVDPIVAHRLYAWIKGSGLFFSADDGASWTAADTGESLRRSGIEAGRAAMTVDRLVPGRVYLGNSGLLQVDTLPGN